MGKSDLLKDGMKSGLDGLLSSTKKSPQKKETAPAKAEKPKTVQERPRERYIAISSSTKACIPA